MGAMTGLTWWNPNTGVWFWHESGAVLDETSKVRTGSLEDQRLKSEVREASQVLFENG